MSGDIGTLEVSIFVLLCISGRLSVGLPVTGYSLLKYF